MLLDKALDENPPVTIREGGVLADGYDDNENWSEGGLVWKGQERPSWQTLAASADSSI